MIPVKLTISGFLSYREPAEIDFTGLHVACITGRNGAGKSTMLDAMTWALFGEARKNDDSVINDNAPDQTAKVDFEFRYENASYLARRQKTRGKSTIAEFFIRSEDGSAWKALTEKRVADTNKRICDILHLDYRTFINVSFFLQGKADQFTGQNATERKKILSNILDLDVWEDYKARTTELRKETEMSVQQLDRLIRESEDELKEGPARQQRLETIRAQIETAEKDYANADTQWRLAKAAETSLSGMKAALTRKQQDEDRQARQIRIQQEALETRRKELETLRGKLTGAETIEQNYSRLLEIRGQMEKLNTDAMEFNRLESMKVRAEQTVQSTEKQLRFEHDQLLKEKNEIESQLPERDRLNSELSRMKAELDQLTAAYSRKGELDRQLEELKDQGNLIKNDISVLDSKAKDISEKLENLRANQGGICPTCGREMDEAHCRTHAAELSAQLDGIRQQKDRKEADVQSARNRYRSVQAEAKQLESTQPRISDLKVGIGTGEQKIRSINEHLERWEKEKQTRFSDTERSLRSGDFCSAERDVIRKASAQLAALAYDRSEHEKVKTQLNGLSGAEAAHQELIRSQSRVEPLEQDIREKTAALSDAVEHLKQLREERETAEQDYRKLEEQMPDITAIEQARDHAAAIRNRLFIDLGQAEQQVLHLDEARANLERYGAEFKEKRTLIERCKTLEKAFGKDGIPALLIEQAVPEIEEQANNLLQQLSNGTMSLQMNTQGTYKSKKDEVKETLEILITDPYGTREYEMFSGGEAFRINFSIRLALSRLLAQRAGSRLQTLVIDEGFGSQDDEGRARLAEAITAVRNDFEKILVITHLSELKEAFPSRIEVEKTMDGSRVEVIP